MLIQVTPQKLSYLKRLERILVSRGILFKKLLIMHGKGEFAKIKGSICNVPIETSNICKMLPRPADSNKLILVKLKRDLKYRSHAIFEPVRPTVVYEAIRFLKDHNEFYSDVLVNEDLSSDEMIKFLDEEQNENVVECSEEEEHDSFHNHSTSSNETALISEVPNTVENENLIVAPGQGKSPISVFNDKFGEELAFPYLFPDGKFGYKVERDIPISPVKYFNQRLLNYTQRFAGDADYIFLLDQ